MTVKTSQKWSKIKLGDITQVIDCPHSTPEWKESGVFAIRNFNLSNGRIVRQKESFVSDEEFVIRTKRARPSSGDLVLSREAPIGTVGYINTDEKMCLGQRVVLIRPEKVDSKFLLYQLLSPIVQHQFNQSNGTGTTVSNLRIPIIKDTQIILPDSRTQKQIADVLSAYDDLIENNNRRIKILEETAQKIYTEWFVNFRFPGYEKVKMADSGTEFGMIPEGWEVKMLGEVASDKRKQADPHTLDKETPYVGLEHIPRNSIVMSDWGRAVDVISTKLLFQKGDILFGKIRPYLHKVVIASVPGITSSDTIVISSLEEKYIALVLMLSSSVDFVAHAAKTSQGTQMPRADWKTLTKYPVVIPDAATLQTFNKFMNNAIDEMNGLMLVSRNLLASRDLLIPHLVSGKLEIK